MGADEEGTLAQLKEHRRALVDPKITEHRGRIVKTTGDGILVEFSSVLDAIRTGVEVQRGMALRNVNVPQRERIEFRVGIHQGDVITEGGDIFGEGQYSSAPGKPCYARGSVCQAGSRRTLSENSTSHSRIWASSSSRTSADQCAFIEFRRAA